MVESAKKIVSKSGCSGLRIREMATLAGVNLGTFHYHFKSKDRFKRIVLQEVYDGFFSKLSVASRDGKTSFSQLRASLLVMGGFIREEHELCFALFRDLFNADPEVLRFVGANVPRHVSVLGELVLRCQDEGSIVRLPVHQVLAFLFTSMNGPTLVGFALKKRIRSAKGSEGRSKKMELEEIISPEAIEQRVDLALKGLKP